MDNAVNIFLSYARKDEKLAAQLRYYLRPLEMQGLAAVWADRYIRGEEKQADEIKKHLDAAQIVLLLVSPDYFASSSLTNREIEKFIAEKRKTRDAQIIPVLLRPVSLEGTPLEKLSPLPKEGAAVTRWSNRDMAFLDITDNIHNVINNLEVKLLPSARKARVSYQQSLWEQDLPSPNPYAHEFTILKGDLQETSNYIRSYKEKLLATDDPKQKDNARYAIKGLESKFNSLVDAYNKLRGKLELPPRSIDDVRELLSAL
jgi:hypothetical protein